MHKCASIPNGTSARLPRSILFLLFHPLLHTPCLISWFCDGINAYRLDKTFSECIKRYYEDKIRKAQKHQKSLTGHREALGTVLKQAFIRIECFFSNRYCTHCPVSKPQARSSFRKFTRI